LDWNVVLGSLPYALGVTGVIFGKHIDKYNMDKARRIYTLPVVIGERTARYSIVGMWILQYLAVIYLVLTGFFTPVMLIVILGLRTFFQMVPMFRSPKPDEKPADYPDVWPNYFVAAAFVHNRRFGLLFLMGLILDAILVVWLLK
jgi:1,4-dihydroxy-2-naphthoate octaprenyltransferase